MRSFCGWRWLPPAGESGNQGTALSAQGGPLSGAPCHGFARGVIRHTGKRLAGKGSSTGPVVVPDAVGPSGGGQGVGVAQVDQARRRGDLNRPRGRPSLTLPIPERGEPILLHATAWCSVKEEHCEALAQETVVGMSTSTPA